MTPHQDFIATTLEAAGRSTRLDDGAVAALVAICLTADDAKACKQAQAHVLEKGPPAVGAWLHTARRLRSLKKLGPVLDELRAAGVEARAFIRALMVLSLGASSFIDRGEPADAALQAALAEHSGDEASVFALLAHVHRFSLHLEGTFPAGASRLRALRTLLLEGKLTSAANVEELAALPHPLCLDLRLQKDPLQHFAVAASRVSWLRICVRKTFANSAALAPFVALERLELSHTAIASIDPLSAKETLTHLDLRETRVSDLSVLRDARALRFLDVHGTPVSDVTPLTALSLTTLRLPTTVRSFEPLRTMRSLAELSLRTAEGLESLSGLEQLTSLDLAFDPAGAPTIDLAELPPLPRLAELKLGWANVRNLGALAALPALESVVLSRAGCDAQQLDGLRRARPRLTIHA